LFMFAVKEPELHCVEIKSEDAFICNYNQSSPLVLLVLPPNTTPLFEIASLI